MLYSWKVNAQAVDDTDAAVVADVLESAVRDERNDPDEPVDVSFAPAAKLEAVDELEPDVLELDALSALLERCAGVVADDRDTSPNFRDGYLSALADVGAGVGLLEYGPASANVTPLAPAARIAGELGLLALEAGFHSAQALVLADGSNRWAVLGTFVDGDDERVVRVTLEHDGRVTREVLS